MHQYLALIPQKSSLCCALHVLTTLFWCGALHPGHGCQALKEGSLRRIHPLPSPYLWICASSLSHRLFCVAAVMAQVSTACSMTFLTHVECTLPLSARGRLRLARRGGTGSTTCLYHICMVLQQPARNHRQQIACPLDSKTLRQPQAFLFQPLPISPLNRLCCALVSGAPEIRDRGFDVDAFLVYTAPAATT